MNFASLTKRSVISTCFEGRSKTSPCSRKTGLWHNCWFPNAMKVSKKNIEFPENEPWPKLWSSQFPISSQAFKGDFSWVIAEGWTLHWTKYRLGNHPFHHRNFSAFKLSIDYQSCSLLIPGCNHSRGQMFLEEFLSQNPGEKQREVGSIYM